MLDTGASMTIISSEVAKKTGHEDLSEVSRETFSTIKGLISCPIVQREIIVGDTHKKQGLLLTWKMTPTCLVWTFLNQGNI